MNLVFFDIECASVHKTYAKICAFGYVRCDENFNILEKEDILINPRGKFELTDRKGDKGLVLPYEYADFKNYPSFPDVYPRIKHLLEDRENVVIGHAVLNDVKYLNLETRRFHLASFNFTFNDSQLIFMTYKNDFSHQFGLEHIANELGVEFTPHRAADDAYATMRVVEAMCRAKGCTYHELIKDLQLSNGRIVNYSINRPVSRPFKKFNEGKLAAKEERSRARVEFYNNLSRKHYRRGGKLGGATFTFSRPVEDDIKNSVPFVDRIYELGGRYSQKIDTTVFFVCNENDETAKTRAAKSAEGIKVISVDELKKMLFGEAKK